MFVQSWRLGALLIASCSVTVPLASIAGTYQAICGTSECTITVDVARILTPYGVIPTSRVSSWGGSGSSSTDLILGAAATYVLGPVGLVGFLAKTHDYNYLITGYNQDGEKTSVQIRFLNSNPAKQFAQEMVSVTGLGIGQSRTAFEIKELEKRIALEGLGAITSPRPYTLEEEYARDPRSKSNKGLHPVAYKSKNCWSQYLSAKPDLQKWSAANPSASAKLRNKYGDC